MNRSTVPSTIARATLVAGTLDILSACVYAAVAGRTPVQMLAGVASAVLGKTPPDQMLAWAVAGLALHYAIMSVMAAVYVVAAARSALLRTHPYAPGIAYGLATWAVMNLIVLPLRWPDRFPTFAPLPLGEQLFSHVVLVGLPIAVIAARRLSR